MDTMEAYRSPPIKPEPRWGGREDLMDRPPPNDAYRRRSPGKIYRDEPNSATTHPLLCIIPVCSPTQSSILL